MSKTNPGKIVIPKSPTLRRREGAAEIACRRIVTCRRIGFMGIGFIFCALLSGCGSSSHEGMTPVSGVVKYQGKPVPNGSIAFHPVAGGRQAMGLIQSDGSYTLTSYEQGDGAPVGEYQVTVTALKPAEMPAKVESYEDLLVAAPRGSKPVWLVPEKYSQRSRSKLGAEIEAGPNEINFDLD